MIWTRSSGSSRRRSNDQRIHLRHEDAVRRFFQQKAIREALAQIASTSLVERIQGNQHVLLLEAGGIPHKHIPDLIRIVLRLRAKIIELSNGNVETGRTSDA